MNLRRRDDPTDAELQAALEAATPVEEYTDEQDILPAWLRISVSEVHLP